MLTFQIDSFFSSRVEAIAISNKKLLGAPGIATRSKKLLGWRKTVESCWSNVER